MTRSRRIAGVCALLVAGLLTAVAAGCGGGSEGTGNAAASATNAPSTASTAPAENAALAGLPSPDPETSAYSGPEDTFVGPVEGTGFFLGISIVDGEAAGYVCDGEVPEVDPADPEATLAALETSDDDVVSSWLTGGVDGASVTLAAEDGSSFTGTVDGDTLAGSVTLPDGSSHDVSLARVDGDTADGLYRSATSAGDIELTGGWVRVDGQARGKQVVQVAGEAVVDDGPVLGSEAEEPPPGDDVDPLLFKKRRCAKLAAELNRLEFAAVNVLAPLAFDGDEVDEDFANALDQILEMEEPFRDKFGSLGCSLDLLD